MAACDSNELELTTQSGCTRWRGGLPDTGRSTFNMNGRRKPAKLAATARSQAHGRRQLKACLTRRGRKELGAASELDAVLDQRRRAAREQRDASALGQRIQR